MYTESHNLFNFFSHRLQVLCGRLVSPTVFRSLSYALYLLSLSLFLACTFILCLFRSLAACLLWPLACEQMFLLALRESARVRVSFLVLCRCLFHFHFVPQPPRWPSECILWTQLCGSSRFVNIFPLFALRVVLPSFASRRYRYVSTSFVAVFSSLSSLCAVCFVLRYVTKKALHTFALRLFIVSFSHG